jgi:hypothetical protein
MRKSRRARYRQEGPPPLEKSVERDIINAALGLGFHVTKLSQARASQQTPGIPDLYVRCKPKRFRAWIEVKRLGGKPSPEQIGWMEFESACGGIVIVADSVASFVEGLQENGFPVNT